MEQFIQQALYTMAYLGNSKQVALFSVAAQGVCMVIGGLKGEKFISHGSGDFIDVKGTPLEEVFSSKQVQLFPGKMLKNKLPFPSYEEGNGFECLCLPLLGEKQEVKGVAVLYQNQGAVLPYERLQSLDMLCPMITSIIEVNRENDRLVQLMGKDNVTSLYTRSYFDTRLQQEVLRSHRYGKIFSILYIAVDYFAQMNETYGFQEAKKVLQTLSEFFDHEVRKEIDLPCHYSDEEFVILLPNTNAEGAYILGERLRQLCKQQAFTTRQGIPIQVTLSIGVAHSLDTNHYEVPDKTTENQTMNQPTQISKEELMRRAKFMLQTAKEAGCNQVKVWW